jgi:hypothetical protein
MTLTLRDVLVRAWQRGYAPDEIRGCIGADLGRGVFEIDITHPAYPATKRGPPHTKMLRDYLAAAVPLFPGVDMLGKPPPAPDLSRADTPSFLAKARNFAVASAKHVAAGAPMASDAEIIRRHDICMACEFFKDNACQKCGCPVVRAKKYVSKLSWADSECPVGKWGKETPAS